MTENELQFLSNSTRISLSKQNAQELLTQMNEMFTFIKRIDHIDLSHVKEFEHPLLTEARLREDEVKPSYPVHEILKNAPEVYNDSIVVPKVI